MKPELCCLLNSYVKCLLCPKIWCDPCWLLDFKDRDAHFSGYSEKDYTSTDYEGWLKDWRQTEHNKGRKMCDE